MFIFPHCTALKKFSGSRHLQCWGSEQHLTFQKTTRDFSKQKQYLRIRLFDRKLYYQIET